VSACDAYDGIVTMPLRSRFARDILPYGFGCTSVGEREPRRTFEGRAIFPSSSLLVSSCRDTLPTPSQLRLSLQSRPSL
jgi:hypothetical protein